MTVEVIQNCAYDNRHAGTIPDDERKTDSAQSFGVFVTSSVKIFYLFLTGRP